MWGARVRFPSAAPNGNYHGRGCTLSSLADTLRLEVAYCIAAADLSQAQMARRLNISAKHLNQMLTGKVPMNIYWAERIVAASGHKLTIKADRIPGVPLLSVAERMLSVAPGPCSSMDEQPPTERKVAGSSPVAGT